MKPNKQITILKTSLIFLRLQTIWPPRNSELNPPKWFYIVHFLSWFSTTPMWFGIAGHFITGLIQKRPINLDLDVALLVSLTGTYLFNFLFLRDIKSLGEVYIQLSDVETFGKPKNFDNDLKRFNRYAVYHFFYIWGVGLSFLVSPLIEFSKCQEDNLKYNLTESCGLAVFLWSPFDINSDPILEIIGVFLGYCCFYSYGTSSFISFSIRESFQHINLRLRHCSELFVDALRDQIIESRRRKFNTCVQYHNHIIGLAVKLDNCFQNCMFIHVLLTGAILGISGYRFLKSAAINTLALFTGWFMSLVFVCFAGEDLIQESTNIGAAILADTNWNELDVALKKDLVLVIKRSQKAINLHAGPFGSMTIATILAILKTSYSFFTLMSQTIN